MHQLTAGTNPIALLTAGNSERVRSTGELIFGRDLWWTRDAYVAACGLVEALDEAMLRDGKSEAVQMEYAELVYKISMYEARRRRAAEARTTVGD